MELESKFERGVVKKTLPPKVPSLREELELKLAEANKKVRNGNFYQDQLKYYFLN